MYVFNKNRLKAEKRLKDQQRKQRVTENRKHLANVRVVQKNLVFVVGLPMRLADPDVSLFFLLKLKFFLFTEALNALLDIDKLLSFVFTCIFFSLMSYFRF